MTIQQLFAPVIPVPRHHWLGTVVLLFAATSVQAGPWQPLFNGRNLTGWNALGDASYHVENGAIVGTTALSGDNSFLITEENYGDFILELEVTQEGGPANSGIQFRSERVPSQRDGRVSGYQCEIDPSARAWTGGLYEEGRREWLYPVSLNPAVQPSLYQPGRWNRIRIEAIGTSLRTWVNGVPVAHLVDDRTAAGFIGLQVHGVKAAAEAGRRILWRDLRIQTRDLQPSPPADIPIRNLIPNSLCPAEQAQAWRLLWDGQTLRGWREARSDRASPCSWKIADGELRLAKSDDGESQPRTDLVTDEKFSSFELQLEFKLTVGADSGIEYLVDDSRKAGDGSIAGLEFQLGDNHMDNPPAAADLHALAALNELIAPGPVPASGGIAPRIGEWQSARIVVRGPHVEHWLNGIKVVDYTRDSVAFRARVAASKFAAIPGFGAGVEGRMLLQDHGTEVRFRSLKVRPLP